MTNDSQICYNSTVIEVKKRKASWLKKVLLNFHGAQLHFTEKQLKEFELEYERLIDEEIQTQENDQEIG